jgi:hypothetical protein
MDANNAVEELQVATGWKDISLVGESIVLRFDIQEMKCITGLKQGTDCLYLEFDEFKQIPISFLVTQGNTVHQYWTIGNRLHRTGDLPAYVAYDPDKDRILRRWYWNGLKHRLTGPAQEMTKGFKVADIDGFSNFYQETWDYMTLEWFQEGFPSRFPYCAKATLEEGQRIKNKTTNRVQSPREDLPALVVENCTLEWDNFKPNQEFRPVKAMIMELRELHNSDGEITGRECSQCDFTWQRGEDIFPAQQHTAFNEVFKCDLFPLIDLWGPFYREEDTEFILITEFNRIDGSSK